MFIEGAPSHSTHIRITVGAPHPKGSTCMGKTAVVLLKMRHEEYIAACTSRVLRIDYNYLDGIEWGMNGLYLRIGIIPKGFIMPHSS